MASDNMKYPHRRGSAYFSVIYQESKLAKKIYTIISGRWRPRVSIGAKTLIAFLLIITVLAGGFYYFTSVTLSAAVEKDALTEIDSKMQGGWRLYHSRMEQMKFGMLQAGTGEDVKAGFIKKDKEFFKELLNTYKTVRPYVDLWAVVDERGNVIGRPNGSVGDKLDLNVLKKALETGEPVMSAERVGRQVLLMENTELASKVDASGLMQFSVVPIFSEGRLSGAFVTGILLNGNDWLPNSIYENFHIHSSILSIESKTGSKVISATALPKGIFNPLTALPENVIKTVTSGNHFHKRIELDGSDIFLGIEPIYDIKGEIIGGMAVGISGSIIERHITSIENRIFIFALIGTFISIMLAYFSYRDTSRPIKAIRSAMKDTESGVLEVELNLRTRDDFEQIGVGFNRMVEAIRVREVRLRRFNELSKILIQYNDPDVLLERALSSVIELTGSNLGVVYIYDDETGVLKPAVSSGIGEAELKKLNKGEGLGGRCASTQKTVVLEDITSADLTLEAGLLKIRPAGLVWFPMCYREKTKGVLVLGSLNPYTSEEAGHIELLVTQLAIALDNALIHKEIEKLSVTDPLTGIFNRRRFVEVLDNEFKASKRYKYNLGVLMVDVDNFKSINDTYGHQQGDVVLTELSRLLREKTRTTDVWARYGGEEFIGLITHCGLEGMQILSEKLRKSVEGHRFPGMNGKKITVSIGVGYYPFEGVKDMDDLIKIADDNLYEAKGNGKNRVVMHKWPGPVRVITGQGV